MNPVRSELVAQNHLVGFTIKKSKLYQHANFTVGCVRN
jgi:hypothetical protein